jgi:hypothetical protein
MVAMPEFYVVTVYELFGAVFGLVLGGTPQVNTVLNMAVGSNHKYAVILHGLRSLRWL